MKKEEFLKKLRGNDPDRYEVIEGLTALILSAWYDLPYTDEEIDIEFRKLASRLLEKGEEYLIKEGYSVGLIED